MRTVAVAGAALALLVAGCTSGQEADDRTPSAATGGSDDSAGTPSETPSETQAENASESPSESPTETSTVKPLTGPVMDVQGISIQLPEGYRIGYDTPVVSTAQGPLGIVLLSAIAGERWSLDRLLKDEQRTDGEMQTVQRLPDTTLDGLSAYHYGGRRDSYVIRDAFGTWDSGYQVVVRFDLEDYKPRAKRRELIESVVATYDSPSD